MITDKKNRLRRTMMFLNCQTPRLTKDPYVFEPDSLIFDLEDAVSENQKDSARFSLYEALTSVDYGDIEKVVRINGLDTPHWREDIRVSVAAGCDTIRIPKVENPAMVQEVENVVGAAEQEFGLEIGSTLLMAAIESAIGVIRAFDIAASSPRMMGIALSGGDYTKDLQTTLSKGGIELSGARKLLVIAARAAKVKCFDTVNTNLKDMDAFRAEVEMIKQLGYDGKSIINPKQIEIVHEIFTPTEKEIIYAERVVREIDEKKARGIGVFTIDGKMIDIAFYDVAKKTLALAKAAGVYDGGAL